MRGPGGSRRHRLAAALPSSGASRHPRAQPEDGPLPIGEGVQNGRAFGAAGLTSVTF
jgi:hypothetical protein